VEWLGTAAPRCEVIGHEDLGYLVFGDPQWDVPRFDNQADIAHLSEGLSPAIDARGSTFQRSLDRGGKLIHYQGWADPQFSPFASTSYFNQVATVHGGVSTVQHGYRLFMASGMGQLWRRRRAKQLSIRSRCAGELGSRRRQTF
jgi:Tannase and feruloyl esterase